MRRLLALSVVFVLACSTATQLRAEFIPGSLHYASNQLPGAIYDISGGGNFSGASAVATGVGPNLGQIAWSSDLSTMYSTAYGTNYVYQTSSSGVSTSYLSMPSVTGLVWTQDDRLLVVQRNSTSIIWDITDPLNRFTYATVPSTARNMTQLPTGEILVLGDGGRIWNVAGGTTSLWALVSGANTGGDIDYTSDGRVYASFYGGGVAGVYDVTGGGTITSGPFAASTGYSLFGLAIDRRTDQILCAVAGNNFVLDITAGGAFSSSSPKWAYNIPITNDMAIDFVPFASPAAVPEPSSLALLAVGVFGLAWRFRRRKMT